MLRVLNAFTYFIIHYIFNFVGAAAASRLYVEAITKLARQSQQGTWGGSADIGEFIFHQFL